MHHVKSVRHCTPCLAMYFRDFLSLLVRFCVTNKWIACFLQYTYLWTNGYPGVKWNLLQWINILYTPLFITLFITYTMYASGLFLWACGFFWIAAATWASLYHINKVWWFRTRVLREKNVRERYGCVYGSVRTNISLCNNGYTIPHFPLFDISPCSLYFTLETTYWKTAA